MRSRCRLKRLGFIAAQLMPKPGARQVLARVVTVDDLPGGGWSVIDERTWRSGVSVPATKWGRRARAAGSVTAWRSFEAVAARQWCWVQVMPLVSEPDALSALEGIGDRLLRNLRAEVTLLREHDVAIEAFPGAGRVWAHEQHTIGPDGEGVARTLAAAARIPFNAVGIGYGRGGVLKFIVLEYVARVPYQAWERLCYLALAWHRRRRTRFLARLTATASFPSRRLLAAHHLNASTAGRRFMGRPVVARDTGMPARLGSAGSRRRSR